VNHVRRTREAHPTKTLIAGNVVTGEMVEELILSGADIVKVMEQDGMRWNASMPLTSSFEVI
jgi:IMP dehydrogenase/GMP reductase